MSTISKEGFISHLKSSDFLHKVEQKNFFNMKMKARLWIFKIKSHTFGRRRALAMCEVMSCEFVGKTRRRCDVMSYEFVEEG
jgi:hypothetical protein